MSWLAGVFDLMSQERFAFSFIGLYSIKSQFSSHKDILLSINSFFLSFNDISVPLSDVVVEHVSLCRVCRNFYISDIF